MLSYIKPDPGGLDSHFFVLLIIIITILLLSPRPTRQLVTLAVRKHVELLRTQLWRC